MSAVDWVCKKISLEGASEQLSPITISCQEVLACANVTTCCSPQGTILGLLLCLIKINDTTNFVLSTVKLYVDDTKIYRQIVDPIKNPQPLQLDLSNLMELARKWQLRFNADTV